MRNIWTNARREYGLYFSSPAAYAVIFITLLVVGVLFYLNVSFAVSNTQFVPGVNIILGPLAVVLMLATPALTGRLISDELRMGSIELLLTAPVRDLELVVGKWLGAFLFFLTLLATTLVYPVMLNTFVDGGIDQGPFLTGYLGMIFLGAALLAIGVFISTLFSNQIATFFVTLGVLILFWWVVSPAAQIAGAGPIGDFIRYFDLQGHYFDNYLQGIIDLRDVTFYVSVTVVALFMARTAIELRRVG